MGNENSLPEDGVEGELHSPVSEAGPAESIISSVTGMAGRLSRRASSSSLAQGSGQHSPVAAPDVDMSHLSEEEKAQIAAVIERAKWLQEEEMQRVRYTELEQEYTEYTTTVATRRASAAGQVVEREVCPICTSTELRADYKTKCADCQKFVCNGCGNCDTSLPAKSQDWLCSLCQKRRNLVTASGMWYHGQPSTGVMPQVQSSDETQAKQQQASQLPITQKTLGHQDHHQQQLQQQQQQQQHQRQQEQQQQAQRQQKQTTHQTRPQDGQPTLHQEGTLQRKQGQHPMQKPEQDDAKLQQTAKSQQESRSGALQQQQQQPEQRQEMGPPGQLMGPPGQQMVPSGQQMPHGPPQQSHQNWTQQHHPQHPHHSQQPPNQPQQALHPHIQQHPQQYPQLRGPNDPNLNQRGPHPGKVGPPSGPRFGPPGPHNQQGPPPYGPPGPQQGQGQRPHQGQFGPPYGVPIDPKQRQQQQQQYRQPPPQHKQMQSGMQGRPQQAQQREPAHDAHGPLNQQQQQKAQTKGPGQVPGKDGRPHGSPPKQHPAPQGTQGHNEQWRDQTNRDPQHIKRGPDFQEEQRRIGQEDYDYSSDSQSRSRKSPRPQNLTLSRQHSANSTSSDDESSKEKEREKKTKEEAEEKERILREQEKRDRELRGERERETKERERQRLEDEAKLREMAEREMQQMREREQLKKQQEAAAQHGPEFMHQPARPDMRGQPRAGAEGAEGLKKKPTALDRVHHDHVNMKEQDRSQSPSRRSPKSPPRSPSWMRYRESPPRSPPVRMLSPNRSPTERFPSTFVDRSPPGMRDDVYGEEYVDQYGNIFSFDHHDMHGDPLGERRGSGDVPPPKPARMLDQYDFHDDEHSNINSHGVLDLASYAATVASDTAHLTSMSVSPTNLHVPAPSEQEHYLEVSPEQESISPPSPNYFEEMEDMEFAEPTPKNIDYQNTKRQKIKPPTTDWSPVTDLSPILDVSPSIERLEQEKMLMEQRKTQGHEPDIQQRQGAKLDTHERQRHAEQESSQLKADLKRYKHVEDISRVGNGDPSIGDSNKRQQPKHTIKPDTKDPASALPSMTKIKSTKEVKDIDSKKDSKPLDPTQRTRDKKEPPMARPKPDHRNTGRSYIEAFAPHRDMHNHPGFEVEAEREIDLDDDLPPKKWDKEKKDEKKVKRSLPEPTPEILATARKPGTRDVDRRDQKGHAARREQLQSQSSLNGDSTTTTKGTTSRKPPIRSASLEGDLPKSREGKVKRSPLYLTLHESEDDQLFTPKYRVLKSPVSPRSRDTFNPTRGEFEYDLSPTGEGVSAEARAHLYPSPEPLPDQELSPPVPASPSVPELEPDELGYFSHWSQPKHSRSRSHNTKLSTHANTTDQMKIQSPDDPSKKVRRRLPPVPPDQEPVSVRRPRSKSVEPHEDKAGSEKEILRKRLQEKEAEQRRHGPGDKGKLTGKAVKDQANARVRPQSASVKRGQGDENKQPSAQSRLGTGSNKREPPARPKVPPKPPPKPQVKQGGKQPPKTAPKPGKPSQKSAPKPMTQKPSPKKKMPKPPIETINIYGLQVPVDVKSLKQRIKEEMQIVTASRRLKIDEMDEIRRMEAEMAEREKERRVKEEQEERERKIKEIERKRDIERIEKDKREELKAMADKTIPERPKYDPRRKITPPAATLTARMSPQASPRRARHKRQNSDPMIAKFSPIEEDRDIESDMSYKLGLEARRIASTIGRLSPQPLRHPIRRSGAMTPPGTSEFEDSHYGTLPRHFLNPNLSRSTEVLHRYSRVESAGRLAASRSETNIPLTAGPRSRTPTYFSDDDDKRRKQEKKHLLQIEIEKRKRQLEDNARLQYELRQLSQSADITRMELEDARLNYQRHLQNLKQEVVPTGIIKPLDYMDIAAPEPELYSHHEYTLYREKLDQMAQQDFYMPERAGGAGYSASEYLAHRSEHSPTKQEFDPAFVTAHMPSGDFPLADVYYADGRYVYVPTAHPVPYPEKGDASAHMYPGFTGSRDSGMSSSMTIADAFAHKTELEMAAAPFEGYAGSPLTTDTETSPPSDTTPAMPILDDVTKRSRSLLRSVGSRPLSDDMEKYFQAEDPLTAMFRADSEHSIADSDDNIMEGGVTIRRSERKKLQHGQARSLDSEPPPPRKYKFPTKRILLTRDPKDRSVKAWNMPLSITISSPQTGSNGIGMKIIGGKVIPGTDSRVGAYVAAIYPGGVADQLHGELQEGDQVLEWNGVTLTGKSYEEVQQIISAPNGEIELVVRPGANMGAKHSNTMSTLRSDSCHSSYDNLDFTSDYDDFDRYIEPERGVDPDVLAAQLEDIHDRMSPGGSPSSSQQDMYLTPSMSTPGSSEQTDPPSPSVELPPSEDKHPHRAREKVDWGEIQLQLSYDDYDGTLNVHVIQARRLQAKDKNGLSDPFVKVILTPSRSQELKRRTKTIPRTLDPEWHQTLVFMNIPRQELTCKTIEVTVWDHDRFKPNDFLGEIRMDLSDSNYLDNKPHWYHLRDREESIGVHQASRPLAGSGSLQTSSSSSASRHMRPPGHEHAHGAGRSPRPSRTSQLSTPDQGASTKYSPGLGRRQTGHAGEPKGENKEFKKESIDSEMKKNENSTNCEQTSASTQRKKLSSLSRQCPAKEESRVNSPMCTSDKIKPKQTEVSFAVNTYEPDRKKHHLENPRKSHPEKYEKGKPSSHKLSPGKKTIGGCNSFTTAPDDNVPKPKPILESKEIQRLREETPTRQSVQEQIEQRQRLSPEKKLRKCQDWQDKHQEVHQHHRHHSYRYRKPTYPRMGTQSATTSPTKPTSPKHVPTHTRHHSLQDDYIHGSGSPSSPFSIGSHVSLSQSSYVSSDTLTSFSYDSVITGYQQNGYLEMDSPPPYNKYFYSSSIEEDSISMFSMGPGQVLPSSLMDSESDSFENTSYFVTGELMLGLKHDVSAKNLQVSILHCRNINSRLFPDDITRDWYVKMYLRLGEDLSKVKKRKTHTQRCPTDPAFHEIFNYHTDCKNVYLEVSLWIHKGIFGPNKAIGMTLVALDQLQFEDEKEFFSYYKLLAQRKY